MEPILFQKYNFSFQFDAQFLIQPSAFSFPQPSVFSLIVSIQFSSAIMQFSVLLSAFNFQFNRQ